MQNETVVPTLVKDLSEAASVQSRAANRFWLALIAVSFLTVLPSANDSTRELPFNLGSVEEAYFIPLTVLLLSVLTIAFAAAHAQMMRVERLVYRLLHQPDLHGFRHTPLDPQDLFDAFRTSSLDRVSPLAQIARGKYQFFSDKGSCPRSRILATAIYYGFLKVLSLLVYVGFPILALFVACQRFTSATWPNELPYAGKYVVYVFVFGAALALLQTLLIDLIAVARTLRVITARASPTEGGPSI